MSTQLVGLKRAFEEVSPNEDYSLDRLIRIVGKRTGKAETVIGADPYIAGLVDIINNTLDFKECIQWMFSCSQYSPNENTLRQLFHKVGPISQKEQFLYAIPVQRRGIVYGDFIERAALEREYEKAQKAFKQAERKEVLTDRVYASFVSFAYQEGKYKDVQSLIEEAKSKNRFGADLCARLMDVARNTNKESDLSIIIYEGQAQNCLDQQVIPEEAVRFVTTPPSSPAWNFSSTLKT